MTTDDGRPQTAAGQAQGQPQGVARTRSAELRAEMEAFRAGAEVQAQARLEAVRQSLMVEIQVRLEMYERMIGEVEEMEGQAQGPARTNPAGGAAGSGDPAGTEDG